MNQFIIRSTVIALGFTSLSTLCYAQDTQAVTTLINTEAVWSGFYGGLNIGGIFNKANLNSSHLGFISPNGLCDAKTRFSSFFPGLQAGYLHQLNSKIAMGIELDYTHDNKKQGIAACACDHFSTISDQFAISNKQQGSLRGRIGYVLNQSLLPFFTAGGSLANLGINYNNEAGDHYSKTTSRTGWLVGTGLEWGLSQAWSIRAEYYYEHYGQALNLKIPQVYDLYDAGGKGRASLFANNVRVAINYWL